MRLLAPIVILAAVALPAPAASHEGPVYGSTPFVQDGVLVGGGTSWGLLLNDEDGTPLWTCVEALDLTLEPPFWARVPSGDVLAGTLEGLRVTDDGGCTWRPSPGPLVGLPTTAVAVDPGDAGRLWVVAGAAGFQRLFRTEDGAQTWDEVEVDLEGLVVSRLALADGGERVRVAAVREDDLVTVVLGSDDGGGSWLSPAALDGWSNVVLLHLSDDGALLLFTATSGDAPFLVGLDADLTSGTQTLSALDSPARDATLYGDDILLITEVDGLHRLRIGGELQQLLVGGPTRCVKTVEGLLLGCGDDPLLPQFQLGEDVWSWVSLIDFEDVQMRDCPDETLAGVVCPLAWDLLQNPVIVDDDDSAADDDDDDDTTPDFLADDDDDDGGDCACAAGAGGVTGGGWLLLLAGLSRRRRTGR